MPRVTSSVGDRALEIINISLQTANDIKQNNVKKELDILSRKANSDLATLNRT